MLLKNSNWLTALAGLLFLIAGVRDAFFPRHLSISAYPTSNVVGNLALGTLFLIGAGIAQRRLRNQA